MLPVLKAPVEQQLHPQADTEKRLFLRLLPNDRHQAGVVQLPPGIAESANTGQDDPVRRPEAVGVAGDLRLKAQGLQAGHQGKEVPHAVVYNRDHLQHTFRAGNFIPVFFVQGRGHLQGPAGALEHGLQNVVGVLPRHLPDMEGLHLL